MTKKEKLIVAELIMIFKKHRRLGPTKLAELVRVAFEREVGYCSETKKTTI